MNRSFHIFGMFFLGLSVVCGVFKSIIELQLGAQLYFLQHFADWFLLSTIISLVGSGFLLTYLYHQKFRFAFWTGLLLAIISAIQFAILYFRLILVDRGLDKYNIIALILSLAAGVLFAFSLLFSKVSKKTWLKVAGILLLLTHLVFGGAFVWGLMVQNIFDNGTFEALSQWILLFSNLIPFCFMLHFRNELKLLPKEEAQLKQNEMKEGLIAAAGLISLALVLYFGVNVAQESVWSVAWSKKGPAEAAQLAKSFEARTFVSSSGDTLHYLFMKPLNYDPQKKYPLVICLHGGPIPVNKYAKDHVEVPEPAPLLSKSENRKKYPAFLFVPQGPPGYSWGGLPNFPKVDSLVFGALQALEKAFLVDDKRRYVAGGSGGGYGSWYFIGTRPEMFAAAIPFCGAGDAKLAYNMAKVPVWAFHGSEDRNVPVSGSREMVAAIKKAGGNPRYTEFAGVGHNVWPSINKTPGLLDWLFAQKRN